MKRASLPLCLFILSSVLVAQEALEPKFTVIPQPGSPATMQILTRNVPEVSLSSHSGKQITAVRLGWYAGARSAVLGPRSSSPGLRAGGTVRFALSVLAPRAVRMRGEVAFFIAELRFADGSSWRADMRQVENEAGKRARRKTTVT